jgi:predicted RecB family nuclease
MRGVQQFVDSCLSKGSISRQNITGTVMRAYAVSPYACYCHFHVDANEQDPNSRFGELLKAWGVELEERYVDSKDPDVRYRRFGYDGPGFKAFVAAALAGERYIYNPPLFFLADNLAGKPDLLERDDSAPSEFGRHHYRVTEIKFSSEFEQKNKRHYLLQALLYNFLLGKIQGYVPKRFSMVDRHFAESVFDYQLYEAELKTAFKEIEDIRSGKTKPDPVYGTCGEAYWSRYCDRQAIAARDVSLIPFLKDPRIRSQMIAAKIRVFDQVAKLSPDEISKFKWVGTRGRLIAEYAKCLVSGRPTISSRVVLPAPKDAEVYFDVEDTGSVHPRIPHFVFMIGAVVRKTGGSPECHSFVADSEKGVGRKATEFLELLDGLGDYQAYFWSQKEMVEFQKIFDAHGIAGKEVQRFFSSSLDLKEIFDGKVFFPVHGNSVKEVGRFLGYNWREQDVDAMEGMALTYEYLERADKEALRKVQTYNYDDCLAMITIKDWLVANAS